MAAVEAPARIENSQHEGFRRSFSPLASMRSMAMHPSTWDKMMLLYSQVWHMRDPSGNWESMYCMAQAIETGGTKLLLLKLVPSQKLELADPC